jgi:type I restriction enzyme S subunit
MSREMKDSGIAWIGEIPKGWKVGKVKHFYQFITGFTPDTKKDYYYDENGIPWVTISDLSGKFIEETKMGISQKYIELNNPIVVPQNSLLYSFKLSEDKLLEQNLNYIQMKQ